MTVHKIIWKFVDFTKTSGLLLYGKYDVINIKNIKKLILEAAQFTLDKVYITLLTH